MKKAYSLVLFGLLLCSSFASSREISRPTTITQLTSLSIRLIPGSKCRLPIPYGPIVSSRMWTSNSPQRDGPRFSPMEMQPSRHSNALMTNKP